MPTYTNSTSDIIFAGDPYIRLVPGETTTDKYIKDLPTGVTLKSHEPYVQPWVLVPADDDDLYQVYSYDNICIYNASDDVATISANTDDDNAYPVPSNSVQVFSNEQRLFGCLGVLTKGAGTVFVFGVK